MTMGRAANTNGVRPELDEDNEVLRRSSLLERREARAAKDAAAAAELYATNELASLAANWKARASVRAIAPVKGALVVPCVHKKWGAARHGLTAHVVPGKSITLHGELPPGSRYVKDPETGRFSTTNTEAMPIRREFKIGDTAECHSYNLVYMGRIKSITAKTVTIVEHEGHSMEKTYRLSLYLFAEKNWDFDMEAACKRNADWTD
jgi:hypothetical protein